MASPTLAELQQAFFRSIAARPGAGAYDPVVVGVIAPSPTLTPAARLGVYADMYLARLQDCLRENFPRTAEILGGARWDGLTRAYLAAYPSEHPSVRHVGRCFAAFLADAGEPAWLAELARFEWARLDVFDAPDTPALTAAELAAVPPDEWGSLRFRLVPGFQVFESAWPVDRVWAGEIEPGEVVETPTRLKVWRQDFMVYHAPAAPAEAAALASLMADAPFSDVCEAFAEGRPLEEAVPDAVGRLARWIDDGLLASPLRFRAL